MKNIIFHHLLNSIFLLYGNGSKFPYVRKRQVQKWQDNELICILALDNYNKIIFLLYLFRIPYITKRLEIFCTHNEVFVSFLDDIVSYQRNAFTKTAFWEANLLKAEIGQQTSWYAFASSIIIYKSRLEKLIWYCDTIKCSFFGNCVYHNCNIIKNVEMSTKTSQDNGHVYCSIWNSSVWCTI